MRKLALLVAFLPVLSVFSQQGGYKVYHSDGNVDAYPGETAVSVSLNDDSLHYNGHEYVDLGLPSGTRWALTNVGADKNYRNGLHFPFSQAEIETLWGGDWCLPSANQYQELINACQWEWTKVANSQGYMVTGPNGNTLFLPAAGFIDVEPNYTAGYTAGVPGQVAGYWTREGYCFAFAYGNKGLDTHTPALQLSLRPVIGGTNPQDTRSELLKEDAHEYVDLGLSVLWATKDIGDDMPGYFGYDSGYGKVCYFAPGFTEPFSGFYDESWYRAHSPYWLDNGYGIGNYMDYYYNQNDREEEYQEWLQETTRNWKGKLDELGYWLLSEHDAAAVLWGNGWRMPTLSEFRELVENSIETQYGFYGPNGNFLEMSRSKGAGYYEYYGGERKNGSIYLTSSIDGYKGGHCIYNVNNRTSSGTSIWSFYPIRPVKDKPKTGLTDVATTAKQEMVDLGLSVLWANCNWGAATPKDKGEYVAWGESSPKATYSKDNYQFQETATNKWEPAQAMFGKAGWTLPTAQDVKELIDKCTWTREDDGYRVTGPNSNSIFLPYTGFREDAALNFPDEVGFYWTSEGYPTAMRLHNSDIFTSQTKRYLGLAIRPVMPAYHPETGEAQTDWHSAIITCKSKNPTYTQFGVQLCYIENMDNKASGAWNLPASTTSLQGDKYTIQAMLQPATTYYYRAYAVTEDGAILYGDIRQLQTTDEIPAVDLGLSVKWAPVNFGATHEFDTKDWYMHPGNYYPDYRQSISDGWMSSALAPQVTWPEGWQMPTEEEFQELLTACTWEWQEDGYDTESDPYMPNRNGYKVTGPNGNSIFLPASGTVERDTQTPLEIGTAGCYWTQTAAKNQASCYNIFKFTATDRKFSYSPTSSWHSIRLVKK